MTRIFTQTKKRTLADLEQFLMEFDVNVDTHFKAGDAEGGIAAFRQWQGAVTAWLSSLNLGLAQQFSQDSEPKRIKPHARETLRSQFLRSHGARPILYLRKMQKGLAGGTLTIEDLRDHHT